MQQVASIKAAHDWMTAAHLSALVAARQAGDTAAEISLEELKNTLLRGVFVVLFGQFEQAVTAAFERARDRRSENPDWTSRRGWDLPAYRHGRVPFETRLSLVLDRRNPAHGWVLQAYALRNHFAHGGVGQSVSSIDDFVDDLYAWASLLRA